MSITAFQIVAFQNNGFQIAASTGAASPISVQLMLSGSTTWTSVNTDTLLAAGPLTIEYGIPGAGPLDLVAPTGRMQFVLDNDHGNSGNKLGYYSPESTSVRTGFGLGIPVRFSYTIPSSGTYYKFRGSLDSIDPSAGQYRDRRVACISVDWMDEAARFRPNVATQINKRSDEVLTALTTTVPRQPVAVDFDIGDSTFPFSLDNSQSESQTLLTEFQKIAQSELLRIYIRGDTTGGGVLTMENRTRRLTPTIVATFDDSMVTFEARHERSNLINRVKATIHPRRVDATATGILAQLQSTQSVAIGETIMRTLQYNDPSNRATRIGGTNMQTPASTTDWQAFATSSGGGSNLTTGFSVAAVYGANTVAYTIINNSTQDGWITKLQARGQGLYDFDPVQVEASSTSSIDSYGENQLAIDMPYQTEQNTAEAVADFISDTWSLPGAIETRMGYLASANSSTLQIAMMLEPGDAISVHETLTGIFRTYFINHVSLSFERGGHVYCDYILSRALQASFWILDSTSQSQLDETTVVAPF